jgi:four helix bundle protein
MLLITKSSQRKREAHGASFKQLIVWQRAVELSIAVYHLTSSFPKAEQFGLTSELRRASVSVASNIAEGYGRSSRGEYLLFLGHARGSISELQTQLIITSSLNFSPPESHASAEKLSEDVSRLLNALIDKLRVKSRT